MTRSSPRANWEALGLDKTMLMSQLDRLERMGLVVCCSDPRDCRARIPEITVAGNALRAKVASAGAQRRGSGLERLQPRPGQVLPEMLFEIIGDSETGIVP